ncbi:MAG: AAA family ATPase [Oceanococcus sp.]
MRKSPEKKEACVGTEVIEQLASFLPIDRANALAMGQDIPHESRGSILFADISGFVGLTVCLTEHHGPREGAERIAEQLNAAFEMLIAPVHARGGTVVGFSGDAISCQFRNDDGSRAVAAAIAMRKSINDQPSVSVGTQAIKLQIKCSVTQGKILRFHVGSEEYQLIDVLAGEAVVENALGSQLMLSNEILIDAATRAKLDASLQVGSEREAENRKFFAVEAYRSEPETLEGAHKLAYPDSKLTLPWILPPLRSRLISTNRGFLAELRPVASLFLAFSGIDFDLDQAAHEKFSQVIAWVQQSVSRLGGWVVQISTGEKGDYLCVAFGAPIASGDEPQRALDAALQLRALPNEFDFISTVRIGLGYGPTWSGAYGAAARRTFGVHGRQVNLAARLMQRAEEGQILLGDGMADALRGSVSLRACGEIQLKGESRAWPIHEALGRAATTQRHAAMRARTPLVGREKERNILLQLLEDTTEHGFSRTVVFEGEAGIGKSRLLEELLHLASSFEVGVALGAAEPASQNTSFFAWRSLLMELAGMPEGDWPGLASWIQLSLQDEPKLQRFSGLLNQIGPLRLPEDPDLQRLSPEARYDYLQRLLVALTRHCLQARRLLLIIEDAHWLDEESWAVLLALADSEPRLMLVFASRPQGDQPAAVYATLCQRADQWHCRLQALDGEAIRSLLCHRLGVNTLPEPLWQLILDRGQGNPYFSEELAFALRDHELISIENGQLRMPGGMDAVLSVSLPDTVEGVVQSRIDRLDNAEQMTLKVASVIGRAFDFRVLYDIYPQRNDEAALQQQLQRLEALQITPIESTEPNLVYFFRHVITQEVAYARMTRAQRKPIHRELALWLEREYDATERTIQAGELARHWLEAGDIPRCMSYLETAGKQAQDSGSLRETVVHFKQLLILNDAHKQVAEALRIASWHEQLALTYSGLGQLENARTHAELATASLFRPFPRDRKRLLLMLLRQMAIQAWHLLLRAMRIGPGKRMVEANRLLARMFARMAEIGVYREDFLTSFVADVCNINVADRTGLGPEYLRACSNVAFICQVLRWPALKRHYHQRALAAFAQLGGADKVAMITRLTLDMLELGEGKLDELYARGMRLFAIIEDLGDDAALMRMFPSFRVLLSLRGEHHMAMQVTDRFEQYLTAGGHLSQGVDELQATLCTQRANSFMFLGDFPRADAQLQQLKTLDLPSVSEHRRVWVHYGFSRWAMLNADFPAALEHASAMLNLLSIRRPVASILLDPYALSYDLVLCAWEANSQPMFDERTVKWAFRPMQAFAQSFALGRPRLRGFQARMLILRGQMKQARALLEEALNDPVTASLPYDLARLNQAMARAWAPGSAERTAYAQQAISAFEALGARPDAQTTKGLLGEVGFTA